MTRFRVLLAFGLAAFLHPAQAQTATVSGEAVDTTPDCYRGTAIFLPDAASYQACVDAAAADALTRKASANYSARSSSTFTVTYTPPAPPPDVRTWVRIGPEKTSGGVIQSYTLAAPALVRFGAGQKWVEKAMPAGRFQCSTSTFGDPAPGLVKACDREEVGPAPPVDPPVVVPPVVPPTGSGTIKAGELVNLRVVAGPVTLGDGARLDRARVTVNDGPCVIVTGKNVVISESEIGPCGPGEVGKGIDVRAGATLRVYRSHIHDVSSCLYANGAQHPVSIDRSLCTNLRGPFPRGQLYQCNGCKGGSAPSKVTCNVSDQTGTVHNVEDHINTFNSPGLGTGALRTEIAYNKLRGGSPTSNSGTAVIGGDGAGGNAFIHHNVAVNVRNVGIGVAGGQNVEVADNRIYQDGRAVSANVGIYVWDQYSSSCANIKVLRNRVWTRQADGTMNPFWNAGNCSAVEVAGNVWNDASLTPAIFDEPIPECQ